MGRNLTTLHTQPQDEDAIDTRLDYAGVRLSKQPIAQLKGLASAGIRAICRPPETEGDNVGARTTDGVTTIGWW